MRGPAGHGGRVGATDKAGPRRRARAVPGGKRPAPLGREAWLDAARSALIEAGIGGVEVGKLARRLGVTRGGFYWFFRSRARLLDELLAYWERTSAALFEGILRHDTRHGIREFRALVDLWLQETEYDPAWDAAIRDWARTSPKVARVVRRADDRRIEVLRQVFMDLGYGNPEALVRARVTYYHQIGYYALGVRQTRRERLKLLPYYVKVLTGRPA